jgi:hypothetical protein
MLIIVNKIRDFLYSDISKADIKELIFEMFPDMDEATFQECFSEAFCTL